MQSNLSLYGFIFNPTDKCAFRCRHCAYDSGPDKKAEISLFKGQRYMDQLIELNVKKVEFGGGGDPLSTDITEKLITYAHDLQKKTGYKFKIKVVTNGSFATSEEDALRVIKRLRSLGAKIIISDDRYHHEFNQKYMDVLREVTKRHKHLGNLYFGNKFVNGEKPQPIRRARKLLPRNELKWDYLKLCVIGDFMSGIVYGGKTKLYYFPEGIYFCDHRLGYHQDVDRIVDVVKGALKDPLIKLFWFNLGSSLIRIKDGLPEKLRNDLSEVPDCVLCEELYEENPEVLDILRDRSSKIFEKLKMEYPKRGNGIESLLQEITEKSSSW